MSIHQKLLNVEDLENLPADGRRYEIVDGELHMAAAPLKLHQRVLRRLSILFDRAANLDQIGETFFAPVDVRFSPYNQVQPDLIFIRAERAGIYQGSTVHGAPDIVVEVISPTSIEYDEVVKFRLYQDNGVPEYWIVNPLTRTIRRFTIAQGQYVEALAAPDGQVTSPLLPGLAIDPAELFLGMDD
jgi:Uma2 family endonuclease